MPATVDVDLPSDPVFKKRVLRKIDWRLLPILGALYCAALIDRTNVSAARISGLDEELELKVGNRASVALLVFFVGYVLFEIPSNILIRRVGPARLLSAIALAWGAVSFSLGFITTWQQLSILRAILGVLEAGYYPGCVYLISSWYLRYELQQRISAFLLTATVISGFANIFALGLVQLEHVSSYRGWRWIYIIEGAMTMVLAILAYFIIVDFPTSDKNRFLTDEEKKFVVARLAQDGGSGGEKEGEDDDDDNVAWKVIFYTTFADWKIWSFSMIYFAGAGGTYAFTLFLPIILRNSLGFSQTLSFVLSAFPPVFAIAIVMPVAWLADKYHQRGIPTIFQGLLGVLGLCMTGFLEEPVPRYIGTFPGYAGAIGLVVTGMSWMSNNLRGAGKKRAIATAIMISVSGVAGIYSSLVFRQQDAPDYVPGVVAIIAANVLAIVLAGFTTVVLRVQNRKAERGEVVLEGLAGFRYTP